MAGGPQQVASAEILSIHLEISQAPIGLAYTDLGGSLAEIVGSPKKRRLAIEQWPPQWHRDFFQISEFDELLDHLCESRTTSAASLVMLAAAIGAIASEVAIREVLAALYHAFGKSRILEGLAAR